MQRIRERITNQLDQNIEVIESGKPLTEKQRKSIAERLKRARKGFSKLLTWVEFAEQMADFGLWEHDLVDGTITWSDETFRIWGYEPEEVTPSIERFVERIHPEDQDKVIKTYQGSQKKQTEFDITYRLKLPDGQIKFVESHGIHFYDAADNILFTLGTNQNVTESELEKKEMEQSLEENQTILDEIHHRVKNNLAVVAGTLQLQWLQEDDPQIIEKLQNSANRIKTIAGIHQQLYESDHLADVSLGENVEELAKSLISSMETDTNITLNIDYDEVNIDMEQTLPCSLIANEVVTNAMKYAFQESKKGEVSIDLRQNGKQITLKISDNGMGLPEGFSEKQDSLGMSLITTLSAQLEAEYSFESSTEGTDFTLSFAKNT